MQLVDLSQEIYQGMAVWPGHLKTVVFDHMTHEESVGMLENDLSYATTGILINDNGPTHVDSFSHLDPNGQRIGGMPLDLFYGEAICLDVSHRKDLELIDVEDMAIALEKSGQTLNEGDILLIHTGHYARHHGTPAYSSTYPGLDQGAGEWIREHGVRVFGVDNPSPDVPTSRTYPIHLMCREHKMTHYENLANLDQVLNQRFIFAGFPLKLRDGHGGPTRAVAIVDAA